AKRALKPVNDIVDMYRRRWGLAERRIEGTYYQDSRLAVIAQLCPELDFDRAMLPPWFHYVGLVRDVPALAAPVPFPYERLTGAPIVYASLGTLLQSAKPRTFRAIAKACAGRGAQLVITVGGAAGAREALRALPGEPIVVDFAPQLDIIARSTLVITHGGLNTVLESLSHGVPLVAMPIAFDQPGVCARVERSGAGVVVRRHHLTTALPAAVRVVTENERFVRAARRLRSALADCGGVSRAAAIAERALATRAPVMRASPTESTASGGVIDIASRARRRAH
ncbi:MAG: glycosyl transferase family 1, partial [Gemmatimonadota bacterium]|nr:glycosyl transferase family 1 [Gemmatimonadota bacterium]